MSTAIDLNVLSGAGISADFCRELQEGKFQIQASKNEAIVVGSDGARVFRVTKEGVDTGLMKAIFEANSLLQEWVGECRTKARETHGNCDALKEYDGGAALLAFRGDNGKVQVKVEKRHENEKGKYEKHGAYTPFASVNPTLYRACCVAMEQFGTVSTAKEPGYIRLAPQIRFSEKTRSHLPTKENKEKELSKPWSDAIAYTVSADGHKEKHHKNNSNNK